MQALQDYDTVINVIHAVVAESERFSGRKPYPVYRMVILSMSLSDLLTDFKSRHILKSNI